ncbi:Protein of unknown function [Flavobacterium indicum GPTSA100-9 = DSM 17447]|jgi:hypothetical protein|uniref:Uncharacterized protein n=1 Tax=Flavobacterium indicum (strain DSM 17447 / CIP 109464 / GPTSA100-9) TaxID=1094466 RepID=H8XVR9_FLAIG|nr:hypothetical protein [Flavobacterium indicum]CCG54033.1 Protein of unknown function [Flavobacterium indicum GPTSA100-9 = DSM 17447]
MASVKNLKKEVNYVLGDIINIVYIWEMTTTGKPTEASDSLLDSIFDTFDSLMTKINQKGVENKKAHFKQIRKEFEDAANQFVAKVNELN